MSEQVWCPPLKLEAASTCGCTLPVPSPPLATSGCGSQLSVPLFPSPGNGGSDRRNVRHAAGDMLEELSAEDDQEPLPCRTRQDAAPRQVNMRKRRCSKAAGSGGTEDDYCCPLSCTTIAQCTESDRTVNLIALVIQGLLELVYT